MKVLALDSTGKTASVAIVENKNLISEFFLNAGLTHSQTLAPMIEYILKCTNTNLNEIDVFAATTGPGSFTGIRIGVSTVKGMAFSLNKPCVGVSSLLALAHNSYISNSNSKNDKIICPCIDARNDQVYGALFKISSQNLTRLTNDTSISIENLINQIKNYNSDVYFTGDAAELCYNHAQNKNNIKIENTKNRFINAYSVGVAAIDLYNDGNILDANNLNPVYLKLTQAERNLTNIN